jgi:hypothetical protein
MSDQVILGGVGGALAMRKTKGAPAVDITPRIRIFSRLKKIRIGYRSITFSGFSQTAL